MSDFKTEFKKEIIAQFHNGKYLEIHTGDIDDIIEIANKLINKSSTNKKPCSICGALTDRENSRNKSVCIDCSH